MPAIACRPAGCGLPCGGFCQPRKKIRMNVVGGSLQAIGTRARVRLQFCLLIALLLPARQAAAQASINSPYRFIDQSQAVGIWAGAVSSASGTVDIGPQGGSIVGVRYGIRLSGPFTIEAGVGYFPSTR